MSNRTVLTEYTLSTPMLCHELTIALVSDIHERNVDNAAALLEKTRPDLIAVAGDTFERFDNSPLKCYQSNPNIFRRVTLTAAAHFNYFIMRTFCKNNQPSTENAYRFLASAAKVAPVFLSMGNHEELLNEEDKFFLKQHQITLLDNSDIPVTVKGNPLQIGGLSSQKEDRTEKTEAWLSAFARKSGFKLLLCHHPEYFDLMVADKNIDLTLAGHNHGGQIRIFGKGLLSSGGKLFPRYDRGVFDNRMVVSAGCSNTVALPRIGNPREVVLIRLKAGEKEIK